MHCNDLKCGDIVDFLLHHKVILFYESEGCFFFFLGGGAYFMPLVQKIRIWAVMKSKGHYITKNGFYEP